MRKVIAGVFLSLDGVMQAPGAPHEDSTGGFNFGGWLVPYWDEVLGQSMGGLFSAPYDLLLGHKTYEIFAAHWPFIKNDPIADQFNAVTKYVATRSNEPLGWKNSVALRGDAAAEIARLKQQNGPTLLTQGSSDLIQTLLAHDLIDEFNLLTFPLILGRGKKLFGTGATPVGLKLVDSKVSTTGVIISRYVRAGSVTTGSFAPDQPSEAELARRRKWAQEG